MDATLTVHDPGEIPDLERGPISYAAPPVPSHLEGGPPRHESDDHDFDTFVEEQLRSGTSSLHADAMTWMERRLLVRVLAQTGGNKSKACQILGITRGSLRHKISQFGIAIHQTVSVHESDRHY